MLKKQIIITYETKGKKGILTVATVGGPSAPEIFGMLKMAVLQADFRYKETSEIRPVNPIEEQSQ